MAVEDKYINQDIVDGKLGEAFAVSGVNSIVLTETFEVAVADDDGSIYRVFKGVSANVIPSSIVITNDAITDGTDYDLGIYITESGVVKDKDVLADGLDMSSARAEGSGTSGLVTVDVADVKKRIFELAGDTTDIEEIGYDIAFTANTVGSAAGTISVKATFISN